MKVLVLGGVAAGTKAAAKLKRESRDIDVRILTKGRDISYAGCGLPYFIGEIIPDRSDLIVNTPEKFSSLTGVEVVTGAEVTAVDFPSKTVTYTRDGNEEKEGYDRLIIATGAESIVPPVPGVDLKGVFTVRTPDDAEKSPLSVEGHEVIAMPFYKVASAFGNLDNLKTYALYCDQGVMSLMQARELKEKGYHNLKVYRPQKA